MNAKYKYWLDCAGWLIMAAAMIFLVFMGWQYRVWFSAWRPHGSVVGIMLFGMMICAGALSLLALAWFKLVQYWVPTASFKDVFRLYARTQIAKYIPGNVFHLAGRWVGGYRIGLSHQANMGATIYEIAGMLVVAVFISAYGFLSPSFHKGVFQILLGIGLFLGMAAFPFLAVKITAWIVPLCCMANWPLQTRLVFRCGVIPAYFVYIFVFLVLGLLFTGWTWVLSGVGRCASSFYIISVFTTAWLIGFITPGSSGGLGVREAVLVSLMSNNVGVPESMIIAVGFRFITIGGDVLLFVCSFFRPDCSNMSVLPNSHA